MASTPKQAENFDKIIPLFVFYGREFGHVGYTIYWVYVDVEWVYGTGTVSCDYFGGGVWD